MSAQKIPSHDRMTTMEVLKYIIKNFNYPSHTGRCTIYYLIRTHDFPSQHRDILKQSGYWSRKEIEQWVRDKGIEMGTKKEK